MLNLMYSILTVQH